MATTTDEELERLCDDLFGAPSEAESRRSTNMSRLACALEDMCDAGFSAEALEAAVGWHRRPDFETLLDNWDKRAVSEETIISLLQSKPMATATPRPFDSDPVLDALARARVGAPMSPEHAAECAQALERIRAGHFVTQETVRATLDARERRHVACTACAGEGELDGNACAVCEGSGGFCKLCGERFTACISASLCEPPVR